MVLRLISATTVTAFAVAASAATVNVLFVGDDLLLGDFSTGGVPAVFKDMADRIPDLIDTYNVTIQATSGFTLQDHFEKSAAVIGQPQWNWIYLQEQTTLVLPDEQGGNHERFAEGVKNLQSLIQNTSNAHISLFQNWLLPGLVYPAGAPYNQDVYQCGEDLPNIICMQGDISDSLASVSVGFDIGDVAFPGNSFLWSIDDGIADGNPYDGVEAGINLWADDNVKASKAGAYVAALSLLANIASFAPSDVPNGVNSTADALGISSDVATELQARIEWIARS
ncbi:hypothetical protein BKA62DRAFT_660727 [Auriculariales sp. MPI-PUGE-AT-0066]|nr:hypothetical protein BKA62DRAFT_660727 [Auriculariales sp. MPI-PUGE-AT-0066]